MGGWIIKIQAGGFARGERTGCDVKGFGRFGPDAGGLSGAFGGLGRWMFVGNWQGAGQLDGGSSFSWKNRKRCGEGEGRFWKKALDGGQGWTFRQFCGPVGLAGRGRWKARPGMGRKAGDGLAASWGGKGRVGRGRQPVLGQAPGWGASWGGRAGAGDGPAFSDLSRWGRGQTAMGGGAAWRGHRK